MVWGCISAALHICKCSINAERYKRVLEQHLLPSRRRLLQGYAYFSKTKLNHILHLFQQHGFVVQGSSCWTDLPAVQMFHHLKTFQMQQRRPRNPLSDRNGTTFLSQRSSSWSPQFQMFTDVVKRRRDAAQWETWPCPNFFETFCSSSKSR